MALSGELYSNAIFYRTNDSVLLIKLGISVTRFSAMAFLSY